MPKVKKTDYRSKCKKHIFLPVLPLTKCIPPKGLFKPQLKLTPVSKLKTS